MSIWFYIFIGSLCFIFFLFIKIIIIENEIKNIDNSFFEILKSDTNALITVDTNDKNLRKLVSNLNKNLKELRKLELEYKNGNKELKMVITNISHDLRTPLTAIRGYIDLMDNSNFTKKQIKYFNIINNRVKDLTELTEQLFDYSKCMDIQDKIKRKNICINRILEESIADFYNLFKEYNIEPKIDLCSDKVIRLLNENMLKRIFENIISNAIKYGKSNFDVKLYSDGRIEFSNKTDILDVVSIEKIFDRYYTVENAKKSNGIGLSIARQLVELMDGKIWVVYKNNFIVISILF